MSQHNIHKPASGVTSGTIEAKGRQSDDDQFGRTHDSGEADAVKRAADEARDVGQEAGDRLKDAATYARGRAEDVAEGWRHAAAGEIRTLGRAMDAAADQLKEEDEPAKVTGFAKNISQGCDDAADYLDEHGLSRIGDDLGNVARNHPALFLGGLALLGFAAGRVLSAKPPQHRSMRHGSSQDQYARNGHGRDTTSRYGVSDDRVSQYQGERGYRSQPTAEDAARGAHSTATPRSQRDLYPSSTSAQGTHKTPATEEQ